MELKFDGEKFFYAEYGIDSSLYDMKQIKTTIEGVEFLDMQDFDNKQSIINACNDILDVYEVLDSLSTMVDGARNRLISLNLNFSKGYNKNINEKNFLILNNFDFDKNGMNDLFGGRTRFLTYDNNEIQKYIDAYIEKNPELKGVVNSDAVMLENKLETLANWYIKNVPTYQGTSSGSEGSGARKYYQTPFGEKSRGDDCTEFTALYMSYVCGKDLSETYSGGMIDPNGAWAKEAEKNGWKAYNTDEIGSLKPGDVLVSHSGSSINTDDGIMTSSKGHHAEVYLDNNETFGWGSVQESYPLKRTIEPVKVNGKTHYKDSSHDYITVYRYEGNNGDNDINNNLDKNIMFIDKNTK